MKIDTLCIFVKDEPINEVYLGIKKRGFGKGKHVAVGGGVEAGEMPAQAAVREIEEETGIKLSIDQLDKVGKIKFDKQIHEGNHKPIISSTLFNHVQNKLEKLKRK